MTNKELQKKLSKWPDDAIVYDRDQWGNPGRRLDHILGTKEDILPTDNDWGDDPTDVKIIMIGG